MPRGVVTIGRLASSSAGSGRVRAGRAGREDHEHLLATERHRPQRVVGGVLHGDPDLGVAAHHLGRDLRRALGVGERHGDAWVRGAERAGEGRDRVDGERRERAQVEPSRFEPADCRHRGAGHLHVAQRLAGGSDERLTRGGERHAAADAVEEGSAELGFELADRLRHRRLRNELGQRGAGEAALVDDGEEQPELAQIHR